jgi:lipopolysaccharide export LptBFGC system permease protein LptF
LQERSSVFWKSPYLPWGQQIRQDLLLSAVMALGEKVLERVLFPGLHRLSARTLTDDPARIDSLSILFGEAFAQFALIWLFYLVLYTISYLTRRPMKSYATTLVGGILMTFVFVASMSTWFQMPNPPPG